MVLPPEVINMDPHIVPYYIDSCLCRAALGACMFVWGTSTALGAEDRAVG